MGYQPIYQNAKLDRTVGIGPHNGRILTDIKDVEGMAESIKYVFIFEVVNPGTKKVVYSVTLEESRAMPGMMFLCEYPGEAHLNHGRFAPGADLEAFAAKAQEMASAHFGIIVSSNATKRAAALPAKLDLSRRIFFAHLPPDIRSALDQELLVALKPLGVRMESLHDGLTSVLEEPRNHLFAAARAAQLEAPVDILILGAGDATEELAAVELKEIFRCPAFVLLTNDDAGAAHRLRRLKSVQVFTTVERTRLVSTVVESLIIDFPPLPPARRVFLCHLDPTVREMLTLRLEATLGSCPVDIINDEATSLLDNAAEPLSTTAHRIARAGPVDLIIMGSNNGVADLAVTFLRDLFGCPIFVVMSVVDDAAERRLRSAGVTEVFFAPQIEPLFSRVQALLKNFDETAKKLLL
ncbi:MAG: hypothetical protein WCS94_20750 [Verrucomicrobiota bacterium]